MAPNPSTTNSQFRLLTNWHRNHIFVLYKAQVKSPQSMEDNPCCRCRGHAKKKAALASAILFYLTACRRLCPFEKWRGKCPLRPLLSAEHPKIFTKIHVSTKQFWIWYPRGGCAMMSWYIDRLRSYDHCCCRTQAQQQETHVITPSLVATWRQEILLCDMTLWCQWRQAQHIENNCSIKLQYISQLLHAKRPSLKVWEVCVEFQELQKYALVLL